MDSQSKLLKKIEYNTRAKPYAFNAGGKLVAVLVIVIGFVISLSIADSVKKSFAEIEIGGEKDTVAASWASSSILLVVGLLITVLLFKVKPFLSELAGSTSLLHTAGPVS